MCFDMLKEGTSFGKVNVKHLDKVVVGRSI